MGVSEKNIKIIEAIKKTDLNSYKALRDLLDMARVIADEHGDNDLKYALKITDFLKRKIPTLPVTSEFNELYWQTVLLRAQNRRVEDYFLYLEKNRDPDKRFYLPRRKQLVEFGVIQGLQDLVDDEIDFLTVSMPPGTGKLLADNTQILTKKGWKNHGDLEIGDEVISPNGEFVKVINVFQKGFADCMVTFTNGEQVMCHENHEWLVYDRSIAKERILETKKMMLRPMDTGIEGKRGHRYTFQIQNKEPEKGVQKKLPIPPYTFGAWLGDGTNRKPVVTVCDTDSVIVESIVRDGYLIRSCHKQIGCKAIGFEGLRADLRKIGMCFHNFSVEKHIPDTYFTASISQRMELLAGLLDTDGTLNARENRYQYSTTEKRLKDDIVSLISTFGWRCSVAEYEPRISSSGIEGKKEVYVIAFNPTMEIPCRTERKKLTTFSKLRRIAIKSIKKVKPVQGNCIQVSGGLYLAGRTLVTTHNSTAGIYFLSGVMGWFPNEPNLASAHSGMLTRSFYDGVGQIINDEIEYTWREIFKNVKIDAFNAKEQTINLDKPNRFKSLTCRAINASLTGATRCERILYSDDLCSGIEEAMNKERLDKLWQTYNTDLKTRKKNFCKEIHIQTRWSVHDVVGRLQLEHENDKRARFISIPALDENGKSNFLYDFGVGFDKKYFDDMQLSMDDVSFRCLYMNEPVEREGLLYCEDELRRYYELPEQEPDAILAIVDTKDRGTDFEFMPVAYQYGTDYYIEDCVYDNGPIEILDEACAEKMIIHNIHMTQVESNNGGGRTADSIEAKMKAKGGRTKITKRFTTANKETKIIVNSPFVKEHFLFKDKSTYIPNSQYGRMVVALCSYTMAGKNKSDDVPDGMAMLAEYVYGGVYAKCEAMQRPF